MLNSSNNINFTDALRSIMIANSKNNISFHFYLKNQSEFEINKYQLLNNKSLILNSQPYENKHLWLAWFDGSECTSNIRIGGHLISPNGEKFNISKLAGTGTAMDSEYKAFIEVLKEAIRRGAKNIEIYGDNTTVINAANTNDNFGKCSKKYKHYWVSINELMKQFVEIKVLWIPRKLNTIADKLASTPKIPTTVVKSNKSKNQIKNKNWMNQSNVGKILNISTKALGKLLDSLGLRVNGQPTTTSLKKGLARPKTSKFAPVLWHRDNLVKYLVSNNSMQ